MENGLNKLKTVNIFFSIIHFNYLLNLNCCFLHLFFLLITVTSSDNILSYYLLNKDREVCSNVLQWGMKNFALSLAVLSSLSKKADNKFVKFPMSHSSLVQPAWLCNKTQKALNSTMFLSECATKYTFV